MKKEQTQTKRNHQSKEEEATRQETERKMKKEQTQTKRNHQSKEEEATRQETERKKQQAQTERSHRRKEGGFKEASTQGLPNSNKDASTKQKKKTRHEIDLRGFSHEAAVWKVLRRKENESKLKWKKNKLKQNAITNQKKKKLHERKLK